jgi:hypothetical protein
LRDNLHLAVTFAKKKLVYSAAASFLDLIVEAIADLAA